jgi:hypothetical protein
MKSGIFIFFMGFTTHTLVTNVTVFCVEVSVEFKRTEEHAQSVL